jgi:hypothetical protein
VRNGGWITLAIGLTFIGFVFYSLVTVQPVEVVSSHLEHLGDRIFVAGELRNTADKPRAVDLEVHYFDRTGRPLGQDTLKFNRLDAGAVSSFRSPPHALNGVADFSIYINNGRNPYGN